MNELPVNDLQEYLIREFVQDYQDGFLSRRDMIRKVIYITGGAASTATILLTLGCGSGQTVSPTPAPATKVADKPGPQAASAPASPVPGTTASPAASPAAAASPSPAAVPSPAAAAATSPSPSPSPAAAPAATPTGPRSPLAVAANDPAIEGSDITFPGDGGATIMAYQARPRSGGPFPAVLVCHENRGVTEHVKDVARRFAKEGYLAVAVDLLSREGGTARAADADAIPGILSRTPAERHVGDFQAAIRYLASQSGVRPGAYAMTGYCFGGGIVWRTVTRAPELKAAAPYYGPPPSLQEVSNIRAAVLGVYSSDPQDSANRGRDELAAALRQANIVHEIREYPNTFHAFNNDTGNRYNQEASLAAWRDVLDWFRRHVQA